MLRCTATIAMCAMGSIALATATAVAQVPVSTPTDSAPVFERPNGALLRTGSLRYLLSLRRPNGDIAPLGTRVVTVVDSALAGAPGWLIAEARAGTVVETTDSVYVARADLWPARWTATIGRAQFAASFTRDSMFGAVQGYQGRASFGVPVPQGALLSAGMVDRLAELLPLRIGFRAAATLVLVDIAAPRFVPAELLVERDEQLDVAGRVMDCWLLSIRAGAVEERLWIAKAGSRVIRTEQATQGGMLIATLVQ